MSKFKAIIFDMDGILVDSMLHWLRLDEEFFQELEIELTPEIIKNFTGKSIRENMTWLKNRCDLDKSVGELCEDRELWIKTIYDELTEVMPGTEQLIKKIHNTDLKQAIASGAPMTAINKVVNRFKWGEYFDELVSADHVDHVGKPDPGIYLYTASALKVQPEECLVFEDAENGVAAAKAAGMKCIAVPDERWSVGDFSGADLIVNSLADDEVTNFLGF